MQHDIRRAEVVSQVFTAQELDWLLDKLPADSVDSNHQRILNVLSEAFSMAVDRMGE